MGRGRGLWGGQECSDLTYRLYDYNRVDSEGRARELHVEKAMSVMNFGATRAGKVEPVKQERGPLKKVYCAACRYFAVEKWEFREPVSAETEAGHFDVFLFLAGNGRICCGDQKAEYKASQAWRLPAGLGD